MNIKYFIPLITTILFLSFEDVSYCSNALSYEDTVKLIQEIMVDSTSYVRKDSYRYINFKNCILDYNVKGTYPVGTQYDIKYSNVDFSSLNYQVSKVGHDYTAFVILSFNNNIQAKEVVKNISIRTIVINISDYEKAQILYKAFLHLGELCGASKSPLKFDKLVL